MEVNGDSVLETVLQCGARHGVTRAGVCRLGDLSGFIECRGRSQLPASGSVILLLLPYYTGEHPDRNVSLYAVPDDYHRVAGAILDEVITALRRSCPGALFLPFVDSSPIYEVEAAVRAGLGYRGRNGQLITPWYGSMTFICEIVTDMELEPTPDTAGEQGGCGRCRSCIDACPTGALRKDDFYRSLCRSELTQKKGYLTPWEERQITEGGLAWGCDICTTACPRNRGLARTGVQRFTVNLLPRLSAEKLDTQMTSKSYIWRGKAVLRRNLELIAPQQNDERK